MKSSPLAYLESLGAVSLVTLVAVEGRPLLGLTSAALLYLLPVLASAVRGGQGPALFSALAGATAYNFFLVPPLFTLRVHAPENLVAIFALAAVGLVTGRLATLLNAQRAAALARSSQSREASEFAARLADTPREGILAAGAEWLARNGRQVRVLEPGEPEPNDPAFMETDLAAAAWCRQHGNPTGAGVHILAGSGWTFFPLSPKGRPSDRLLAISLREGEAEWSADEVAHLSNLCEILGRSADRSDLEAERHERERLDQADQLRQSILAALAHDFRTPLTVVIGQLAVLAADSPRAEEALAAARRLDRTMDDLLGLARIESGALIPAVESLDIIDVIDSAVQDAPPPLFLHLDRETSPLLPFCHSDPLLLHHMVCNLLQNAYLHAKSRVRVRGALDGGVVMIEVADDGPGVPPADRSRIFERFQRLETNDRGRSTGLGLAIVKGFGEALGVEVRVAESDLGGASFQLRLPTVGASIP